MNDYALRIASMLWRLIPANPILVRVVHGASKRVRHLWIRTGYLVCLLAVVLFVMIGATGGASATLADLAKSASTMFMWASIAQLALMCFLAPVFTAGAITQERDAQTFNILIVSPLSNAQIVFGSLMSRLFFVLMLLLGGLPIFLLMMVYGGVTLAQIIQSFSIAGATAIITGSLAICISMIRVGTRRTIFSFYLLIGLYLLAVFFLGRWPGTWVDEALPNTRGERLSWLAAFHPFLSLDVALNRMRTPDIEQLSRYARPVAYLIAYPHRAYVMMTLGGSLALTVLAMFFVRRPKEAEAGFLEAVWSRLARREIGERRRKPKPVWNNPVAWREATTRASAAMRGFLQFALLGGGFVTAIVLLVWYIQDGDMAAARQSLSVVLMIELGLILLVATNTAATAITKERESRSMDLLLVTPLTSKYVVRGKLRGLISFTIPLVAVPVFSVLLFAVYGLIERKTPPVVAIETPFEIAALLIAYSAAACMLGLHTSLHSKRTVQAVMISVGIVIIACLVLTLVADSIVTSSNRLGAAIAPLTPFTGVWILTDPIHLFDSSNSELNNNFAAVRAFAAVGSAVALLIYAIVVGSAYRSMVRNFDRIVRRQSGL